MPSRQLHNQLAMKRLQGAGGKDQTTVQLARKRTDGQFDLGIVAYPRRHKREAHRCSRGFERLDVHISGGIARVDEGGDTVHAGRNLPEQFQPFSGCR